MWNYLYELWRSVLRQTSKDPDALPAEVSPRNELREELRRLREARSTLQKTAASYQEFGYDDLARRIQEELVATDRRIGEIRLRLRRNRPACGRG
jgi:hypothetical protein